LKFGYFLILTAALFLGCENAKTQLDFAKIAKENQKEFEFAQICVANQDGFYLKNLDRCNEIYSLLSAKEKEIEIAKKRCLELPLEEYLAIEGCDVILKNAITFNELKALKKG